MRYAVVAAVLTGIAAPALAWGPIIYDNGGPDLLNGNEMCMWLQAEDFVLRGDLPVWDVHFWTIEGAPGFNGILDYYFYEDAGGMPGNGIAKGAAQKLERVKTGREVYGLYEYEMAFYLEKPLELKAGVVYWLGLHANGSFQNRDEVYWETTGANGTYSGHELYMGEGDWYANGQEHAFYLTGIPEPGVTALLGGLVLAGVGYLRRRK